MASPPPPHPPDTSKQAAWLAAACCITARIAVLFWADHVYDDTFISWRVARHLAEGDGAVFNLGERVAASTSLPHVLLCALWWKLFGPLGLQVDRVFACLVDAVTVATVARTLVRSPALPREAAGWGCAAFTMYYTLGSESALSIPSGLETSLYCAALSQAVLALAERRETALGAWAGVAAMVRPDGALLVLFVLVASVVWRRTRASLVCASLLVPYLILQTWYYGSPIPQSMVAKHLLNHTPWRSWNTLLRTFAWGRGQPLIAALAFVGVAYSGRSPFVRALALWGALYGAALATFTSFWAWYWAPLNLAFACAFGHGIAHTYAAVRDSGTRPTLARVCTGVALLGLTAELGYILSVDVPYVAGHRHASATQDRRIAAYLNAETKTDSTILAERLGVLAFYTERRFDDYPGLVSPAVTRALTRLGRQVGFGPGDTEALRAVLDGVRPSHAVLREYEYEAALFAGALAKYRAVRVFPAEPGGLAFAPEHANMVIVERLSE